MKNYKIKENLELMIDEHIKRLSTILINNNEQNIYKYKAELEILKLDNTNKINEIVLSNDSLSINLQKKQEELLQKEQLYQAMINQIETAKYTTHKLHDSYGGNKDEIKKIINEINLLYKKRTTKRKKNLNIHYDDSFEKLINFDLEKGSIKDLEELTNELNELIKNLCQINQQNIKELFYCDITELLKKLKIILIEAIDNEDQQFTLASLNEATSEDVVSTSSDVDTTEEDFEDHQNLLIKNHHQNVLIKNNNIKIDNIKNNISIEFRSINRHDEKIPIISNNIKDFLNIRLTSNNINEYIKKTIVVIKSIKGITSCENNKYCKIREFLIELLEILKNVYINNFDPNDLADFTSVTTVVDKDVNKVTKKKHKIKNFTDIKNILNEIKNISNEIKTGTSDDSIDEKIMRDIFKITMFKVDEIFIEDLLELTINLFSLCKNFCRNHRIHKKYKPFCKIKILLKELIIKLEEDSNREVDPKAFEYNDDNDLNEVQSSTDDEIEASSAKVYELKVQIREYLKLIKEKYNASIPWGVLGKSILPYDTIKDVLDFESNYGVKKKTIKELKPLITKLIDDAYDVIGPARQNGKSEILSIYYSSQNIEKLIDTIEKEYKGYNIEKASIYKSSNQKEKIIRYIGLIVDKYASLPNSYRFPKYSTMYKIIEEVKIFKLKKRTIPFLKSLIQELYNEAKKSQSYYDNNDYNIAIIDIIKYSDKILKIIDSL